MRVTRAYRIARLVAGMIMCLGAVMVTGGVAASAAPHASRALKVSPGHFGKGSVGSSKADSATASLPVPKFNDSTLTVSLTIPTLACSPMHPDCEWMLFMNEPREPGRPTVGMITGTSGTLTLPYPHYCGYVQADSLIGPAPWTYVSGVTHLTFGCIPPTTTTTTSTSTTTTSTTSTTTTSTTSTTTTTTTRPAATSTTVPPNVAASSTIPNGNSVLPFTAAITSNASTTTTIANGSSQLPFTGVDIKALVLLGSLLILVGGLLLTTVESRRRALARATTVTLDQAKVSARKTSSWFLGD